MQYFIMCTFTKDADVCSVAGTPELHLIRYSRAFDRGFFICGELGFTVSLTA